ncbi:cellulase family glycosylhydrolase [Flavobacterium zepuense]|uniref:Cellulase family glycosylhydrolase n=1 Tax=Flavobacterium zepuense TaxID=2593302 RepID=A0A552V9U8_9FLAO|nr:beta-galactosidase [Flavobacterium zepuense]TRW27253.1 cellulase family glycosylhydrolase [Flavobacterium zepuense]
MNIKTYTIFLGLLFSAIMANGQTQLHEINTVVPQKKIYNNHLKLGGSNKKGDNIKVNNFYMSLNNKPFIPIAGEFHYSRYPSRYWDESIKKMKAGGINVIATYVFWNFVEDTEGQFNWKGNNDLRKFIDLCAKNDIYVILRVGPFAHAELRNGGLPDWLMGKPLMIRSNDQLYLSYVERFYNEIGSQVKGTYFKDNGPIIGIQIENEYQHSAAPWGFSYPGQPLDLTASERDLEATHEGVSVAAGNNPYADLGNDHMKVLKALALKAGMDTPLYTATGWGYAAIIPNESIPVTAAYAYPSWTGNKDLSPFFLYKDMQVHPDYEPVRYKPQDYPAFAAELGSGIMSTYSRRPIAEHKSFDAMINRCLGGGCNGIGYYMYHGGSTPKGNNYFSDEAYGMPKISYDFQAPISEYGQIREGFHRLKLLHFFIQEFGETFAPMATILPANNATLKQDNVKDLRYAVRAKGNSGFVFINNFQDDAITTDKNNIQIKIKTTKGDILIPQSGGFSIKSEENAIFPYNFNLNGANLVYATAQLLTKSDDGQKPYYVFFTPEGVSAEFLFSDKATIQPGAGATISKKGKETLVKCANGTSEFTITIKGKETKVLVVDKATALKAYVVTIDGHRHVLFSDAVALQDGYTIKFLSHEKNSFDVSIYPKTNKKITADVGSVSLIATTDIFTSMAVTLPKTDPTVTSSHVGEKKYVVHLPETLGNLNDITLQVDYIADTAMGFLDGELIADEFYKGIPWQIGLKQFMPNAASKDMVLYLRPLHKDAPFLNDLHTQSVPDFGTKKELISVKGISLIPEYQTTLKFL